MSQKENPLDYVEKFQHLLKEAIKYGYEISFDENSTFPFSPFEVLIEAAIDIFLILRKYLNQGVLSQRPNQGLGFSKSHQDVLGNPKQFRIYYPSKYYWDPKAEQYFFRLAEAFVRIKRQESIRTSFVHLMEDLDLKSPTLKKIGTRKKVQKRFHWWRRQQRRLRR